MKAIKTTGSINDQGQLDLDRPLVDGSNRRVEVIVLLSEEVAPEIEGESKAEILTDLRQAWHEAMTGQTVPASRIWAGIDHD
jgi:hypothetical protein